MGHVAVQNLREVLGNATFRVTGICPDDLMASATDTRKRDVERVQESIPILEQMIDDTTEGLSYENYNGTDIPTSYTDGSLLDPDVEHFQRAGW